MRVLHVIQPTDGGSALATATLATAQARAGHDVVVACPDGELVRRLESAGVARLPWQAVREPTTSLLREWRRLRALVREVRPDVAVLHATKAGLVGRVLLRGRIPTVYQPHGWGFRQCRGLKARAVVAWERFACRWTDATVCVGATERDEAIALGFRADWHVVANGLDLAAFRDLAGLDRATARAHLGLGRGPVVTCVARLADLKGHETLLDAWDRVVTKVPAATLVLVGDGPLRQALEARAPASVWFAGEVDDVGTWLRACDVAVQPSLTEAGVSLAALEAMACGRSVVVTDVGDHRALVDMNGAGAVVPAAEPGPLAAALVDRLADGVLAAAEGAAGSRAATQFGSEARVATFDTILRDVLGRRLPWSERAFGDALHVTVVFTAGVLGGAERWALTLLDATDRLDVSAVVLGPGGPLQEELTRRGIEVETVATGTTPLALARTAQRLARVLRRRRPDVVLANGSKAAVCAVGAGLAARTRVVWARHDFARDAVLGRRLARRVDAVVATSQELLDAIGAAGTAIVPPRPGVAPAPRDEAALYWAARGLHIAAERPVAAIVGRVDAHKGHAAAIGALACPGGADWRLAVVGGDDPAAPGATQALRTFAAEAGVADRVIFCGAVPDAGRHLGAFDAVVAPTPPWTGTGPFGGEGFGLVVMEALLAGTPVVCSPSVPASGLAPDAVEALDGCSADEVAAALARVLARAPAAKAAAAHIWERLPTAEVQADRLVGVLAATAARAGAGHTARPPVSVVTTVLNEAEGIDTLLRSVLTQAGPDDEVVVVDGGSTDATAAHVAAVAADDPRLTLVVAPGANIAAGRNIGIGAARHEVVVTTDGGCRQADGWLDAMAAPFADTDRPGLVLGSYLPGDATALEAAMKYALYPVPREAGHPSWWSRVYSRFLGLAYDPTMPTGRTSAFTVDAWAQAGGYPEHLYAAEDVTFGRAVAGAGYRCELTTDARVAWEHRRDLRATARMFYVYGVGDGRSGDPKLVARDAVRALAYGGGALLVVAGGSRGRLAAALGAAVYMSLPVQRTRGIRERAAVVARIPVVLAVQDVAKAAGAAVGIVGRHRGDDHHATGGRVADRTGAGQRHAEPDTRSVTAPLPVAQPCDDVAEAVGEAAR